jgi:hypothetical protein
MGWEEVAKVLTWTFHRVNKEFGKGDDNIRSAGAWSPSKSRLEH